MATKTRERTPTQARTNAAPQHQPKARAGAALLDAEMLKRLYACMLKCRMVEERARLLYGEGKLAGDYGAAAGLEATDVGTTIDLLPGDTLAHSRRNLVTEIMQGKPLKFVFAHLYGLKTKREPRRSSAAQQDIGTDVARSYKVQKKANVVVALSGDGTTSLRAWHEAVKFAGKQKLPIIYVIENSRCAELEPARVQAAVDDLSAAAQAHGVPGITVDGTDVVAVYRVAQEAIKHARAGGGPTLIECKTWNGQSQAKPGRHRSPKKVEHWKSRDPIVAMKRYLQKQQLWSNAWKQQLVDTYNREIEAAVKFAENSR